MSRLIPRGSSTRAPRHAARLDVLNGEGAFDVLARATELEALGRDVVHLEIGEPDFATPPHVVEAGVRALRDRETRYSPPAGIPALREAIAVTAAERGIRADPADVLVTPGAKPAVFYAILSLVEPGDEVLIPDPGFPIYPSAVRFAGGIPVPYAPDALGRGDVGTLVATVTPRTRVLILNAPGNPTGASLDTATIEAIATLAERHDLAIVSDEIYARLTYDGHPAPSPAAHPLLRPRTIVVDGFSKAYAMTGWRLGFAILPPPLAERVVTLAVNGHSCTPVFVQRAGIAALTGPQRCVADTVAELTRRREIVTAGLDAIPGVRCAPPAGAFYAFPDFTSVLAPANLSIATFASQLLEGCGVATLPGTTFGAAGDGHLRLSFAAAAGLRTALDRIRAAVAALGTPSATRPTPQETLT